MYCIVALVLTLAVTLNTTQNPRANEETNLSSQPNSTGGKSLSYITVQFNMRVYVHSSSYTRYYPKSKSK